MHWKHVFEVYALQSSMKNLRKSGEVRVKHVSELYSSSSIHLIIDNEYITQIRIYPLPLAHTYTAYTIYDLKETIRGM